MKKVVLMALLLVLAFGLTACGGEKIDNLKENVGNTARKVAGQEPVATDKELAQEVAKKFATDLFTITDKSESNFVGGDQYVMASLREDFVSMVENDLFPSYADMMKQAKKKENLPEVASVDIQNLKEDDSTFNGVTAKGYNMDAVVTYKVKDNGFDINKVNVRVSYIDNTWQITSTNF